MRRAEITEKLQQAIALAQAGQQADARRLLEEVVAADPQQTLAWMWLATVAGDRDERVRYLARALALEPELLALDEPTSGLDPDRSQNFVKLIRTLQSELNFTVIMVTHDIDTLAGLATRVAALADRRVVATGTLQEVLAVDHPFIRSFFGGARAMAALDRSA